MSVSQRKFGIVFVVILLVLDLAVGHPLIHVSGISPLSDDVANINTRSIVDNTHDAKEVQRRVLLESGTGLQKESADVQELNRRSPTFGNSRRGGYYRTGANGGGIRGGVYRGRGRGGRYGHGRNGGGRFRGGRFGNGGSGGYYRQGGIGYPG